VAYIQDRLRYGHTLGRFDYLALAHDTDGTAVGSLDLAEERNRLEREQRKLSRKEYHSANWEKQRQRVAECHQRIKRKRRDFLHKLLAHYAREYALVAVEDLNVKGMLESPRNSRNTASAAGIRSPIYSNTSASAKAHILWRLTQKTRRRNVCHVASKQTSRCGCVNIPALPVGSKQIEIQMRLSTFFFADLPN